MHFLKLHLVEFDEVNLVQQIHNRIVYIVVEEFIQDLDVADVIDVVQQLHSRLLIGLVIWI